MDEMLHLFYCLLFPVRAFEKIENWGSKGVLELGNPGERGVLAVWEIQSGGGGQKCLPSVRGGVWIFSGITHLKQHVVGCLKFKHRPAH